jgi:hypothetical protein
MKRILSSAPVRRDHRSRINRRHVGVASIFTKQVGSGDHQNFLTVVLALQLHYILDVKKEENVTVD